jgi:uncharacterized protein
MIISTSFEVDAAPETVWGYLLDVERVARCVPGAELTEVVDAKTFRGKIGVKLGPIEVAYRGTVQLEEVDEEQRRVRLRASGNEARGRGGASASVTSRVQAAGGKTNVSMETDLAVTGVVAQFGRSSVMQEVAQRMARRFAACLEQEIRAARQAG